MVDSERFAAHEASWWAALQGVSERPHVLSGATVCYRIAEAVLQIATEDLSLLEALGRHYGECAVSAVAASEPARVRCSVNRVPESPLVAIRFFEGAPADPALAALALMHPPRDAPPYAVRNAPLTGWQVVGGATQTLLAAADTVVVVDPRWLPEDFLAEFLVSATLSAQAGLLVLHAAALQIGDGGVLLSGPSRAGKTTTSAHLAARGHRLLGDEMAVVRMPTRELVPLRRSLSLRSGPRAADLAEMLERVGIREERTAVGGKTAPIRIDRLFPGSLPSRLPLRAVFFLSGFADRPSLARFRPTLNDLDVFDSLAANEVAFASWGLTPARRTLTILALKQMLTRLSCWQLKVGPPVETAQLIERTMEEQ